ncbi:MULTISPECIES: HDOD domain-containing protein [unclassified Motilimonas]|uniref:HDOD domain-containing protein n=1 Tax=Motilimonas TaxID=1914248 RepID=UPI001E4D6FB0|nr:MULTISPECIES: HDOD domain-containing protein [unclassified Motilimonas]MCE0558226.1 HDOD domain-containing protein [Motilimonas sp. E26]MDO6526406.1 HDOD domain-containing protein [Motilimonas sp. 1_MG-2023]
MAINITSQERALLKSISIPPRPAVLLTVAEEAGKPEPDVSVIAKAISSDVSIASAVLQVVNSAAFRRAKEIQSINQAVMMLGLKRIIPLVKAVALRSAMSSHALLDDFWEQATEVAQASSVVAKLLGKDALVDNAYMLGLFHLSGVPVMMLGFEQYPALYAQLDELGWPALTEREHQSFGTAHTTIGALLSQQWMLPKALVEIIYYQQDAAGFYQSGEMPPVALDLLSILKIARHVVLNNSDSEWAQVQVPIGEHFNLDDIQLEELLDRADEELTTQC